MTESVLQNQPIQITNVSLRDVAPIMTLLINWLYPSIWGQIFVHIFGYIYGVYFTMSWTKKLMAAFSTRPILWLLKVSSNVSLGCRSFVDDSPWKKSVHTWAMKNKLYYPTAMGIKINTLQGSLWNNLYYGKLQTISSTKIKCLHGENLKKVLFKTGEQRTLVTESQKNLTRNKHSQRKKNKQPPFAIYWWCSFWISSWCMMCMIFI